MPRTKNPPQLFLGIDNGVSGSIGGVYRGNTTFTNRFIRTPTFVQQNYTKKKNNITRIDTLELDRILDEWIGDIGIESVFAMVERPMINPTRFNASISASRALEATLVVLEDFKLAFIYVDSKEWQKKLLPKGIQGTTELKRASLDIGTRMFPGFAEEFKKQKDADGMLIAEHCRRVMS